MILPNLVKVLNLDKVDSDRVRLAPKISVKNIDMEEEAAFFKHLIWRIYYGKRYEVIIIIWIVSSLYTFSLKNTAINQAQKKTSEMNLKFLVL